MGRHGREEVSDPRVSGRYRSAFDVWEYRDGRAHFTDMTFTLTNAHGSWTGASFVARGADGSHYIRGIAYGTGTNKGLRYVMVLHDKPSGSADGRMHFFGKYRLLSELGTWEGNWYGVVTKDRRYIQFVDALGTGDFEGLRYRHVDTGTYPKSSPKTITLVVNGWIESMK